MLFAPASLVHSYGTENRPVSKFIPPRSEVFEYIVFKGSDIKDLTVHPREPQTQEQPQPEADPAIVSVSGRQAVNSLHCWRDVASFLPHRVLRWACRLCSMGAHHLGPPCSRTTFHLGCMVLTPACRSMDNLPQWACTPTPLPWGCPLVLGSRAPLLCAHQTWPTVIHLDPKHIHHVEALDLLLCL